MTDPADDPLCQRATACKTVPKHVDCSLWRPPAMDSSGTLNLHAQTVAERPATKYVLNSTLVSNSLPVGNVIYNHPRLGYLGANTGIT